MTEFYPKQQSFHQHYIISPQQHFSTGTLFTYTMYIYLYSSLVFYCRINTEQSDQNILPPPPVHPTEPDTRSYEYILKDDPNNQITLQ